MKKYTLFSFVFILSFILMGFNAKAVSAYDSGCISGGPYSTTTGQLCGNPTAVVGCQSGFAFSPVTGQSCAGVSGSVSASSDSADLAQFNNLFSSFSSSRTSDNIKSLQQFLKDQGYYFGKIDGKYGKISARAVSDFQSDNNDNNNNNKNDNIECSPRPACLDAIDGQPRCMMAEPAGGWCPIKPIQTNSQPPVISGVNGPQSLNVNQTGTWTVTAYDTNKGIGNLSYSVDWGDKGLDSSSALNSVPSSQSATFTHSYVQAGTYTPTFTVTNFDGKTAQTSLSVNVTSNIQSQAPVISGVSGPQSLNVNQQGTWTVAASDSNNGNLYYSVNWGDKYKQGDLGFSAQWIPFSQNSTFIHNYQQTGNYTPTFKVANYSSEQTAQTSLSVNVIGATTTAPTVTVLSPNGGESYKVGDTINFKWSAPGYDDVIINLVNIDINRSYGTFDAINGLDASTGSASWVVRSTNLPVGKYKVFITAENISNHLVATDYSDNYFTITN